MSFRKAPPPAKCAVPAKRCHCEERSGAAIRIPLRHRPYAYFAILPVGRHPCVPPPIPAAPPNGGAHGHRNRDIPSTHGASVFRRLPKKFLLSAFRFQLNRCTPKAARNPKLRLRVSNYVCFYVLTPPAFSPAAEWRRGSFRCSPPACWGRIRRPATRECDPPFLL